MRKERSGSYQPRLDTLTIKLIKSVYTTRGSGSAGFAILRVWTAWLSSEHCMVVGRNALW
jgi:hypothetical protein